MKKGEHVSLEMHAKSSIEFIIQTLWWAERSIACRALCVNGREVMIRMALACAGPMRPAATLKHEIADGQRDSKEER